MSRIIIQPNQCSWKKEQIVPVEVCEIVQTKHTTSFFTLAPFVLGSLLGVPQVDLVVFGIIALYILAGSLSTNETYEEEFIRKLKEDLTK